MRFIPFLFLVCLISVSHSPPAFAIEWVKVGDAGNNADDTGFGSVSYPYRISKFETTFGEYAEFLNAVAVDDPNGLYTREGMGLIDFGGIARGGEPGEHFYWTFPGQENKPLHGVSFWNALRFANWLHNGKPIEPQGDATTEDGAYTILTEDGRPNSSVTRNPHAKVFLTSEDEWYKAAYYKGGGLNAGYWDFPTQSDEPPVAEPPPGRANSANYARAVRDLSQTDTSDVGAYTNSPSSYGTFDQAGNLWEWNESTYPDDAEQRGIRGSSWIEPRTRTETMSVDFRAWFFATVVDSIFGFRLASLVPPSCDFDDNFVCDVTDLDLLIDAFGSSSERLNLDSSNDVIDKDDRDIWLDEAGTSQHGDPFRLGDTNLDGVVNATDLNVLGNHWLADDVAGWSVGDFNGDRLVDSQDLNPLGLNWQSDIRQATAVVPEPHLSWLALMSVAFSMYVFVSRFAEHRTLHRSPR